MRYFLFLVLALNISTPTNVLADKVKLRVGFIAALSGPVQAYGDATRNGFDLALNEINDGSIQVIYEDDQFIPTKTISAFNKLTQLNNVDVVVCIGSSTCNAIAPLAEARHLPLIGYASDPLVSKNRKFVIRSYPSGQTEGKRTGVEALKREFSKVGVITATHDYPLSWRTGLLSALPPNFVLVDEEVPPTLQDFRSILLKARHKGVANFLICILPGQSGIFAKQAEELGMKPKIGGCAFLEDKNEAVLANGALNGAWYITVSVAPDFAEKYEKKYGNQNTISGAAIHYDLVELLTRVIKENHASDIAKNLMGIGQFNGKAGLLTMQNDNGDQFFSYNLVAREVKAQ